MSDRYQYHITGNDTQGQILDIYPGEQWSRTAQICEDRGYYAKLERRLISNEDYRYMLVDSTGYIWSAKLGILISPWEIFAEVDFVGS